MKNFIRKAWQPLILLLAIVVIDALAILNIVPSSADLFDSFVKIAASAGFLVVALLAFIEHTVFVGVYFPAAVVILISMGNTYGDLSAALTVFCAILTGQIAGYSLSYMIGRYLNKSEMKEIGGTTQFAVFMTYVHPHAGAISSFILGMRNVSWQSFAITLFAALGVWSTFWAIIAYFGLFVVASEIGWDVVFYGYMAVWLGIIAWQVTAQNNISVQPSSKAR